VYLKELQKFLENLYSAKRFWHIIIWVHISFIVAFQMDLSLKVFFWIVIAETTKCTLNFWLWWLTDTNKGKHLYAMSHIDGLLCCLWLYLHQLQCLGSAREKVRLWPILHLSHLCICSNSKGVYLEWTDRHPSNAHHCAIVSKTYLAQPWKSSGG